MRAPELPQDFVWLNTSRPLSLRELRGQLVILDFWTYCCINCMHVLPVLDALEERHRHDPLVVIGVHSGKFDEERDPENVRDAIARYGIHHPVVVDREMKIWHDFAIRSWPTLVVIRPDGSIAAVAPGEPEAPVLEAFVTGELERARERGVLAAAPFRVERAEPVVERTLSYPGKIDVAVDGRIAVSDSAHHRVLVLASTGDVLESIGSGAQGHRDGAFGEAELDDPQGVRFDPDGKNLYIADARNHVVLKADLGARTVETIAGDGKLGAAPLEGESPAKQASLRSPWDLAFGKRRREGEEGDVLYVALAGSHQIAVLDLGRGTIARLAGTGAESIVDGPLDQATFSQPSGLALHGSHELWIADSETSAVRLLDLHHRSVRTFVGTGLFDFGDTDGPPERARLQHCLGITLEGPTPIVADTYNHKLKRVDHATGETIMLFRGADGLILREPGGVAWDPHRKAFLVADTGHHRIVEVSADGGRAKVLEVRGAPALQRRRRGVEAPPPPSRATSWFDVVLDETHPLATGDGTIHLEIKPLGSLHLAKRSKVKVAVEVSRRSDLLLLGAHSIHHEVGENADLAEIALKVRVTDLPDAEIASEMLITLEAIACTDGGIGAPAACIPIRAFVRLPVRLSREGAHDARFQVPVGELP
jgi:DNA-binding beta-propeller fold protein YncE